MSAFESSGELEDTAHLAMLLNVIGLKMKSYSGLPEVVRFTRHVIEHADGEAVRWLKLPAFSMLVNDLSYPVEESWQVYRRLVGLGHSHTIFNYHGWIPGIRMFGQRAKDELRGIGGPGGYDLLEAVATE